MSIRRHLPLSIYSALLQTKILGQIVLLLIFIVCLPVVAGAYTLVMRDNRHIIVPDQFVLSQSHLTYEASPGINVSVRVVNIDVAATEKINGEAPGSFLKRASVQALGVRNNQKIRVLTNDDLEAGRRVRQKREQEAEQRRAALGLSPPETPPQPTAQQQEQALREALADRGEEQSESYWRTRSGALREEILALDGQINFLRTRLIELNSNANSLRSYGIFSGFGGIFAAPSGFPVVTRNNTNAFALRPNTLLPGGMPINRGLIRGTGIISGAVAPTSQFGHRPGRGVTGSHRRHPHYGPNFIYAVPYNIAGYDYGAITLRLQELETARAGLHARWRALEDEARRAGAPPGWLRP